MAISGFDLRRLPDNGGFLASSMGGGWTSTMLSLGEASAPLHLNFNPRTHEAEFVIPDVDLGEDVLRVLGRVL